MSDPEARNHVLNVIIDSKEGCADIYTHDWKLLHQFSLGEGKQRYRAIRDVSEDNTEGETEANDSIDGSELHQLRAELTQAKQREERERAQKLEERAQKIDTEQEVARLKRMIEDMQRNQA